MNEAIEMEVEEVKEKRGEIAAFFDLDGTLLALPSLERRFIRMLRYRRAIPVRNYFLWLREAARLLPRGVSAILQGNKMYLRRVRSFGERDGKDDAVFPRYKSGHEAEGQASALFSKRASKRAWRNPRLPVPAFFAEAIERIIWHAQRGHRIMLVSGTLEPLAKDAARAMEAELGTRGIAVRIRVCATRLEEVGGKWTGRILGEAMFGCAKAQGVKQLAEEMNLNLAQCFAYGDSVNDLAMLEAVGRPAAVNPSRSLALVARKREWPELRWEGREIETDKHRGHRENTENKESHEGAHRSARRQGTDHLDGIEFVRRGSRIVG